MEISIIARPFVKDDGTVVVIQRFTTECSLDEFEEYLSESYRMLKELKLRLLENDKKKEKYSDTGTLPDSTTEIKSDEPEGDRGCGIPQTCGVSDGGSLDAPDTTRCNQQGSDSPGRQPTP